MFQGVVNEGVLEAGCMLLHFCLPLRSGRKFKGLGCVPEIKISDSHPYWHTEIAQMFAVSVIGQGLCAELSTTYSWVYYERVPLLSYKEVSAIIWGDQHNMMPFVNCNSCVMSIEQPRRD